jgi:hypothetical protein
MKVLLVGEGPSELRGALEALVRRLGLAAAEFETDYANRADLHAHHGMGRGFFKRALRWMQRAQQLGYDVLVLVIDEDGKPERSKEFADAQQDSRFTIPRALGVAIRTFDAWMLADEKALSVVLGMNVSRQRTPEGIKDPKSVCGELHENSDGSLSLTKMYAAIAEIIDVELLHERCPKGFAPFAQRVRELSVSG